MKKRLFIGLLVGAMCVGLVGCGGDSSNAGSGSSESVGTEAESDFVMSSILPDAKDIFSDKSISIDRDSDTSYYASISSATSDDFKKYDSALKGGVFTSMDAYGIDDNSGFARYYDSEHKYELDFGYDSKNGGLMTITCDVIQK
ncbi:MULTISPECIES: hypothetical protein [unclassified Coprococcus]|uniref:hypothetical protein n=1 Tax=unclassified Coprococcus TaxID=2684943 RepID=UPI000E49EB2C|nr:MULTISPECIES: hypothetical protein [unclassified Coprococcus]RGI33581.1 hypothetical protein DXB91_12605 [Coprococcus sp. OM06-34AC]RGI40968.1 hypothetical protein DXB88_10845 [Coprococcus sp. OM06-25]